MRLWALVGMFAVLTAAHAIASDCRVSEFKSSNGGTLSEIQRLAYMSLMTSDDYDANSKSMAASGNYGAVSASADYQDMQSRVRQRLDAYKIDKFADYRKSWAESSLDDNGLSAYRSCLARQGGFYVTISALNSDLSKLQVDWFPLTTGNLDGHPIISSSLNVQNVAEIATILSAHTWGRQTVSLQIPLRKNDSSKAADITIDAGGGAELIYIPPPPPQPLPPPVIRLLVTGWIESNESGHKDLNYDAPDYDFSIPFHSTYKDFAVTVTQYDDNKICGQGTITPSALNYPGGTMSATPKFMRAFQIGGQMSGGKVLLVFTYPRFCTGREPQTPPQLGG